jgi:hypothetical protein
MNNNNDRSGSIGFRKKQFCADGEKIILDA